MVHRMSDVSKNLKDEIDELIKVRPRFHVWKREWFYDLPHGFPPKDPGWFDSCVILPGAPGDNHASGFRAMGFVAIRGNQPVFRLAGGSDVVDFDGIGGFGYSSEPHLQ